MKILVVEDDNSLAVALSDFLREQHHTVERARDGQEALSLIEAFPYELLLLDVVLPKLDGISLCRQLRQQGYDLPILLLTARDSFTEKIAGLEAGADDYITKPFEWQELLARIRALVRRASYPLRVILKWGDLCFEPNSRQVRYGRQSLHLTSTEYSLLELFLRHHNRVFSYGDLSDYLWCFKEAPTEATIRSHIKKLRQKLTAAGSPANTIETVYGSGYRLKALPLEEENQERQGQWLEPNRKRTLSALIKSWEQFKPDVLNQVALLEQTAVIWQIGTCSDELWQQAITEAHKLAGLLGTFGFTRGSELSHEMEDLLRTGITQDREQALRLRKLARALRRVLEQPSKARKAEVALPDVQDKLPRLLIVDKDVELTERLRQEAVSWRIQAEVVSSPLAAKTHILHEPPDAVLLDLCFGDGDEDGLTLLAELNALVPMPVLVFTERGAFADRLQVSRLKAQIFLQKPMAPKLVLAAVSRVLHQARISESQVLVVDDDPQMLITLRTLLEPLGLKLTTLVDSRLLWSTLERVVPDLLILDVKMPHVDGIELCQVVRNDPRWIGLPILALTAYADPQTVQQILTAGADDVVGKPITGPELVTRIMSRLERTQLL